MTDDRDLLERAAKAAGMELRWERDPAYIQERWVAYVPCGWAGQPSEREWNPLRESSDALDLAVKLKVDLCFPRDNDMYVDAGPCTVYLIDVRGDRYAATRRAIVRAAASMTPPKDSPQ